MLCLFFGMAITGFPWPRRSVGEMTKILLLVLVLLLLAWGSISARGNSLEANECKHKHLTRETLLVLFLRVYKGLEANKKEPSLEFHSKECQQEAAGSTIGMETSEKLSKDPQICILFLKHEYCPVEGTSGFPLWATGTTSLMGFSAG